MISVDAVVSGVAARSVLVLVWEEEKKMEGDWNLKEAKGGTELTGERVRRAINACGIGVFMPSVWDFLLPTHPAGGHRAGEDGRV